MRQPATVVFVIPGAIVSTANRREHWGTRARRAKRERGQATLIARSVTDSDFRRYVQAYGADIVLRYIQTYKRAAPKALDGDNLGAALKAIRDGVAAALEMDDGSPLLSWETCQQLERRAAANAQAPRVAVVITPRNRPGLGEPEDVF